MDEMDFYEFPTVDPTAYHCNRLAAGATRFTKGTGYRAPTGLTPANG